MSTDTDDQAPEFSQMLLRMTDMWRSNMEQAGEVGKAGREPTIAALAQSTARFEEVAAEDAAHRETSRHRRKHALRHPEKSQT